MHLAYTEAFSIPQFNTTKFAAARMQYTLTYIAKFSN